MELILPYHSGNVWMSSPYGMRTLFGKTEMHRGIDLVGTEKTIIAPVAGKIGWAGTFDDRGSGGSTWEWGNYVRLETEDGYRIYLCHMESVAVQAGQRVNKGDIVGYEGSTGNSTGSHCHFEVRYNGVSVDPTPYLGIPNTAGLCPTKRDYATLVCAKVGLELQTKKYLDAYKYADDLWRKLWNAMAK